MTAGAENDGQMVKISASGDVYWSQRLRLTVNCKMNFHQLPWDVQACNIVLGSYSQGADEVNFQWKAGSPAMDKLDTMTNPEWMIGPQTQVRFASRLPHVDVILQKVTFFRHQFVERIVGLNPKVKVEFSLTRIPNVYVEDIEMMVM